MSSSWMNKHVFKFSDAKNKNNESFLLAWIYSILIGHYETTGLRSIFTLLSPMWTIHFTLVLIQFIRVACLLVCKYTNQKKGWSLYQFRLEFDIFWQKILRSDWSIWCNLGLFSEPDKTLLHPSTDFWSNNFA